MKLEDIKFVKSKYVHECGAAFLNTSNFRRQHVIYKRKQGQRGGRLSGGRLVGIGVAVNPRKHHDYRLAIRISNSSFEKSPFIEGLVKECCGEVDIKVVSAPLPSCCLQETWRQSLVRPMVAGVSVGGRSKFCGTLGAFVRRRGAEGDRARFISNNHVIADTNRSNVGDPIFQPARTERSMGADAKVGQLEFFEEISFERMNSVDAAVALVSDGVEINPGTIPGIGAILGVESSSNLVEEMFEVEKVGKTTGHTKGVVSAFDVDIPCGVSYLPGAVAGFSGQVEIVPSNGVAFSGRGDSGALVVSSKEHKAVGLVFATAREIEGGSYLTYANNIQSALDTLQVELVTN